MPLWLILIVVGVVLFFLGFGSLGHLFLVIGVIVLIVGLIGIFATRGRRGV